MRERENTQEWIVLNAKQMTVLLLDFLYRYLRAGMDSARLWVLLSLSRVKRETGRV